MTATAMPTSAGILYSAGRNDECHTPAYGVAPLLEFLEGRRGQVIWCPFDQASSAFVTVLREAGHTVIHSHIADGQDFYTYEPARWDLMISNPPFTGKRRIVERAIALGKPFALLLPATWLNDAAPAQLFRDDVELQLLLFDKRIEYQHAGKTGRITFASAYFCRGLLPRGVVSRSLAKGGVA